MSELITRSLILIAIALSPAQSAAEDYPGDFAVAVLDTRLFAGLEPYAEILGKVEAGQYFPVISTAVDQYGIQWAEVAAADETSAYLTDIIVLRESESVLQALLKKVNLADISMWDDETVEEVQKRGIEIGFNKTQLLFAKGVPLFERERDGREEWFYRSLVVLIEEGVVVGFTSARRLPHHRSIDIDIGAGDPEFEAVSGRWQELETAESAAPRRAAGGNATGVFRVQIPVRGDYRISARWQPDPENSARVRYKVIQRRTEVAVLRANHKLYQDRWVILGDVKFDSSAPVIIRITAEDDLPFCVDTLRLEYLNEPLSPADTELRLQEAEDNDAVGKTG